MHKFLLLALAPLFLSFFPQGISAQCGLQLLNCNTAVEACDLSLNASHYWNDPLWWDNALQTHDLAEEKIDLNLLVRDTCPGSSLSVRCLLLLDLDGDGTQETSVDSDDFPAAGLVNFGNVMSGGTPRPFDHRPVPADQKWRFALKTTVVGDTSTFSLQWTNDAAPTVFETPELAYGTHRMRWIVTSSAGDLKICQKVFTVKDCKAPLVACLSGLSANILPTGMIQLWATDFLQYTEDNVTPTQLIQLGIRKAGTGTGFPVDANGNPITSVIFNCAELGTQSVEVWAIDVQGNADYCEAQVLVQDGLNCNGTALIEACATTACGNNGVEDVIFVFTSPNFPIPYSDIGSCGSLNQMLPGGIEVTITPWLDDNPLNGVTSYDMVVISNHINGIDLFDTPYQWVAADANNDKVITTSDIVECNKLILGIYTELPHNASGSFVDKNHVFPTPDPLSAPYPGYITVNTSNLPATTPTFVGIKICDVSCGNIVGFYDLEPENQHLIGAPEPNPTSEGAMLPLQLVEAETVLLEVLDFSGRALFRAETPLPAGSALLEIPASALPSAGVYVWRVRAGEISKTGKLLRL